MSLPRTDSSAPGWKELGVRRRFPRIVAASAMAAVLAASPRAMAAACNITGDNVVYVSGASAAAPYLATLAVVLQADFGVQLVFIQTDSCT
jgi:hypothetical protein